MRLIPVSIAILSGLLALAALPITRWVLQAQSDVIAGQRHSPANESMLLSNSVITIEWPYLPQDGSFGAAISAWDTFSHRHPGELQPDLWERMKPFHDYVAANPKDVVARATYANYASCALSYAYPTEPRVRTDAAATRRAELCAKEILFATEGYTEFDPGNADFPMMRSIALEALGRHQEAITELHVAAGCPRYELYSSEMTRTRLNALEKTLGYRGELMRVNARTDYWFYQATGARRWAPRILAEGGMAARRDLLQLGHGIVRTCDSSVDVLVGTSLMSVALAGHSGRVDKIQESDLRDGSQLFGALGASALDDVLKIRRVSASFYDRFGPPAELLTAQTRRSVGAGLLLSFLVVPGLFALMHVVSGWKSRSPRFRKASASLVWFTLFGLPNPPLGTDLICVLVAFLLSLIGGLVFTKRERLWQVTLGVSIFLGASAAWIGWTSALIPTVLVIVAERLSIVEPKLRWMTTVAAVILGLGASALAIQLCLNGTLWPLGLAYFAVFLALVPAAHPPVPSKWLPPVLILLSVGYLGVVGWDLYSDRAIGELLPKTEKVDADAYRAEVGIR